MGGQSSTSAPAPAPASGGQGWWPTRKWWAGTVTALASVVTIWIVQGAFDTEVRLALVPVITHAIVAYLVPNASTPGGVPPSR
jgi:hypothetical protein